MVDLPELDIIGINLKLGDPTWDGQDRLDTLAGQLIVGKLLNPTAEMLRTEGGKIALMQYGVSATGDVPIWPVGSIGNLYDPGYEVKPRVKKVAPSLKIEGDVSRSVEDVLYEDRWDYAQYPATFIGSENVKKILAWVTEYDGTDKFDENDEADRYLLSQLLKCAQRKLKSIAA